MAAAALAITQSAFVALSSAPPPPSAAQLPPRLRAAAWSARHCGHTAPCTCQKACGHTGACSCQKGCGHVGACGCQKTCGHAGACLCGLASAAPAAAAAAAVGVAARRRAGRAARRAGVEETDLAPIPLPLGNVCVDSAMMGYRLFVPRLYNLCKQLGMRPGRMLPSIGFCSDENQGYPIVLITKHFRTFPFNHGYIGGIMALDRHGPHAAHGEDMVIIHAPHVGYDPTTGRYGFYRRKQVEDPNQQVSTDCGKMAAVLERYKQEYASALSNIQVKVEGGEVLVSIGKELLRYGPEGPAEGLRLHFEELLADPTLKSPKYSGSASRTFLASPAFGGQVRAALAALPEPSQSRSDSILLPGAAEARTWRPLREAGLRRLLTSKAFSFRRPEASLQGERHRLERELRPHMSTILTGFWDPELTAALTCAQFEFDRTCHSVQREAAYKGKNLVLVSGLNIDISPDLRDQQTYAFPSTMFLPWAAYVQLSDGRHQVLEQEELVRALFAQSEKNPDAIDIEGSITELFSRPRRKVTVFDRFTGRERAARMV